MATSVGSMSEYGASDSITDPYCDPCFTDGSARPVAGYCPICVEFYCQSCKEAHHRMSATESHKILLGSDMPARQANKPVKYQLCDKHEGEGKDRYCLDHDIIICGICFIRKHKECRVEDVAEASKIFKISTEKASFSADVNRLLNYVQETSNLINSNKDRLEKKRQEILAEALKQRDKLQEKVEQSYKDFSGEVTNLFTDHATILSERQAALDKIVTEIDTLLQSLLQSDTRKHNDQKEFLELYYAAEKVRLYEDKIELFNLTHTNINCALNTNIQPLILTKNKFGELSLQFETFQYSTEFQRITYPYTGPRQDPDKTNVKIAGDKTDCLISGIDITVDGNMLLMDHDNCKVKLFSPDGILLSSLKTPELPKDVAFINKSKAAISMQEKQIGILDIAESFRLSLKSIIETEQFVWGITAYNNNLIITCDTSTEKPRSVQMIDMRGEVLWTAANNYEGKKLFDYPRHLTTCSGDDGDTVIVADKKKHTITVLDAGSGKVIKVCDVRKKKPHGVAVDDQGNIYVCYKSSEISAWSRDMQVETRLTTESKLTKLPWAMAYNSSRSELVLTSKVGDTDYCNFIYRYKISGM